MSEKRSIDGKIFMQKDFARADCFFLFSKTFFIVHNAEKKEKFIEKENLPKIVTE